MIINTMIYRIMEKPTTIFEFFNFKKNASNSKSTTKFQDNNHDTNAIGICARDSEGMTCELCNRFLCR